jgi:hypothetical protein
MGKEGEREEEEDEFDQKECSSIRTGKSFLSFKEALAVFS